MSSVRKIRNGVLLKITSNFLFVILSLSVSVLLNRHYGKETYGLLILVYTVTNFCFLFSDLGAKQTINRFLPKYIAKGKSSEIKDLINASVLFQLSGIIFFSSVIYLFADFLANKLFHYGELGILIKIGIVFFACFSLLDFIFQVFQALQSWMKESLLNIIYLSLYLVLFNTGFYLLNIPLKGVLISNGLACVLVVILGLFLSPKEIRQSLLLRNFSFSGLKSEKKTIVTFGLPLLFNNLGFFVLMWLDKVLIGKYCLLAEVTFYYIAFTFYSGIMFIFKTFYSVFMPFLAGISHSSEEQIQKHFRLIFRYFLQCGILISFLGFFLVEPLVKVLYGLDYSSVITAFRMLTLLVIIRSITNPIYMFLLNVFTLTRTSVFLGFILASITAVLDILLIPVYGYKGAIIAVGVGYLFWILSSLFIRRIRIMIPLDTILKTIVCLLVVIMIFYLLISSGLKNPFVLAPLSTVSYFILLILVREFRSEDILVLRKILNMS